jgi:hypothetical protein
MIETFKEPADRPNHIEGSKSRQGYQLYSADTPAGIHRDGAAFMRPAETSGDCVITDIRD